MIARAGIAVVFGGLAAVPAIVLALLMGHAFGKALVAVTPPTMQDEARPPMPEREVTPTPIPVKAATAHAEPAKEAPAALDECDYDYGSPCWCWGYYNLPQMKSLYGDMHFCDNAEDYIRSVQAFGPPRGGTYIVFENR